MTGADGCPLDKTAKNPERWNPEGPKRARRSHWMMKNIALCFQLHDYVRVIYGASHATDRSFYQTLKILYDRIGMRLHEMEVGKMLEEPQ